jgi:hypothetical protein
MKAENKTTEHNRTVHLTGIEGCTPEMLITVNYVAKPNDSLCYLAVALDSIVIPAIIDGINNAPDLLAALNDLIFAAEAADSGPDTDITITG